MKGYKVYLTKSYDVAELISKAYETDFGKIERVKHGMCDNFDEVPEIYKGQKHYACIVEYKDPERKHYDLIFA